jgi:TatA/E family protein of Tat protein translocase
LEHPNVGRKQLLKMVDLSLFGIGLPQIMLILMIALIIFGPEKLQEVARQLGRWVGQARTWMQEARTELQELTSVQEELMSVKQDLEDIRKDLQNTSQEVLKELDDVRKEATVDVKEMLNNKPLEQYTYEVKETSVETTTPDGSTIVEKEITTEVTIPAATASLDTPDFVDVQPENDAKLVQMVEDAYNEGAIQSMNAYPTVDLNGVALAAATTNGNGNGAYSYDHAPATSSVDAATVEQLQTQLRELSQSHEDLKKQFSQIILHFTEKLDRIEESVTQRT